jgi:hypothetical protein
MSKKKKNEFWTTETMEGPCLVISIITGISRPNTRKDDDGDELIMISEIGWLDTK